jgi:TRAP-type C4-dicarboxylate transport system permease large subunit
MATLRMPHRQWRNPELARSVRDAFWALALAVIACYAFFVALGAFSPTDVWGVTLAIMLLAVLWLVRAWSVSHHHQEGQDPRLAHERERRGF